MIDNGYNPDDAIKKLKGIGVDVRVLSIHNLSKINNYRLVIIICHHINSQDSDALVLDDNTLLPVDVFVHAISTEFTGLLDLAICDSKAMAYEIKALSKYPDALKIQYAEETDVEFRLFIYPDLLKYYSFDQIDDYKQRYRDDYLEAIEEAERKQKEKVKDISSLPEGTKLGSKERVSPSVYSPDCITRGYKFKIQVFLNYDSEKGIVHDIAIGRDHETKPHLIPETLKDIQKGDEVEVRLSMQDVKSNPTDQIIVCGKECTYSETITICDTFAEKVFDVIVCEEYPYKEFWAVVEFNKDGESIIKPYDYKITIEQEPSQKMNNADLVNAMEGHKDFGAAPIMTRTEMAHSVDSKEEVNHRDEKITLFVHPELDENEGWLIHESIKRLVACQNMQDILKYLADLKHHKKVLLPMNTKIAYDELVRMGMPKGEGFSEKKFYKYYRDNCYNK